MENSYLDDLLKFQHRVDQRATSLADDMVKELRASRAVIVGKLAALADDAGKNWDDLSLNRRKELLTAQLAAVDAVLVDVYASAGKSLQEAGEDVIAASAKQAATAMTEITGAATVSLGATFTTDVATAWFESSTVEGLTINNFLNKLQANARDRIVSAGRRAMIEGKSVDAAARMIRMEGIEGSVPGLEGLARTFCLSASNHARDKTIEEHFPDMVGGWKRIGTLDRRTCIACGSMDGKVYKPGEPRPSLPAHWRCRCLYVVQTPTFKELGIDAPELDESTRPAVKHSARTVHHRDGSTSTEFTVESVDQVPASTTYTEWLKRQLQEDPAFVRSVLGKTRFELFKSGKLNLSGMVTDGKIKNLSDL